MPNHRAVPRLAFGLEVKPTDIVSASEAVSGEEKEKLAEAGYWVEPASPFVIHNYILDPNDKTNFENRTARPASSEVAAQRQLADLQPLRQLTRADAYGVGSAGTSKPRRKLTMPPPSQLSLASPSSY